MDTPAIRLTPIVSIAPTRASGMDANRAAHLVNTPKRTSMRPAVWSVLLLAIRVRWIRAMLLSCYAFIIYIPIFSEYVVTAVPIPIEAEIRLPIPEGHSYRQTGGQTFGDDSPIDGVFGWRSLLGDPGQKAVVPEILYYSGQTRGQVSQEEAEVERGHSKHSCQGLFKISIEPPG